MPRKRKVKASFIVPSLGGSRKAKKHKGKKEVSIAPFPITVIMGDTLRAILTSRNEISIVFMRSARAIGDALVARIISATYPNWLRFVVKQFRQTNLVLAEIDSMPGYQFEEFVGEVFRRHGYRVEVTKRSRDQGADILLLLGDRRIVVQTKRQSTKVGNWAVQEIVASKRIYDANEAIVVSNSVFTSPAIVLAEANGVQLIDRSGLERMIDQLKNVP